MRTKHLRKLTPQSPTQKAQQGVSIRKCNRSRKEKRPEEICKICEVIKKILTLLKLKELQGTIQKVRQNFRIFER